MQVSACNLDILSILDCSLNYYMLIVIHFVLMLWYIGLREQLPGSQKILWKSDSTWILPTVNSMGINM